MEGVGEPRRKEEDEGEGRNEGWCSMRGLID